MADQAGSEHYYAVIMAGGGGTRLWPLSRQDRPKQSLRLLGERTMFQTSVDRLTPLFPPERILVVTSARYAEDLQRQCPAVPKDNYILEPAPRGTAPAVALSALELRRRDPHANAVMACLTADHHIGGVERFRQLLVAAKEVAEHDYLVTLGIAPTYPATGFGYIQRGDRLGEFGGFEAFRAERFKEKPSADEAERLVAGGRHSWNSGMFVWRASRIWMEFERQMPQLASEVQDYLAGPVRRDADWDMLPNTTIDYGIMEGARDVAVIPAGGLDWNDIGTWEALLDILDRDSAGNVVVGADHLSLETTGTLIHTVRGASRPRLIATVGVSDLVIVDTEDVLLVCRRDRSQEVKLLVDQLKQSDSGREYL